MSAWEEAIPIHHNFPRLHVQADKMARSREAFNNLLTDEQLSRIWDALSAPPTAPAAASPAYECVNFHHDW